MTQMQEAARLCLVLEIKRDSDPSARFEAALSALIPASLVLSPGEGLSIEPAAAAPLVRAAQKAGVATLIEADAATAQALGADGVHLPWRDDIVPAYELVRSTLGAQMIVGADAGRSRHDAMLLGEAGADYVGFGIPPHVGDREGAAARRLDLVEWWAEIFEVPVIAFDVESPDDAARLAAAGADFVSLRISSGEDIAGLKSRLREFAAAVDMPEVVP